MHRRIILCGMMGSGKSTVGRTMARYLDWDFVDIDEEIIRVTGKPISAIFEEDGAEYFRELESRLLRDALGRHAHAIIAPGGGAVLMPENYDLMQGAGSMVLLRAQPGTIAERLKNVEDRPLLFKGENVRARVEEILARREFIYEQIPIQVPTDNRTPENVSLEALERIARQLEGTDH